jgi:CelD/BcsL family acetyltransferase involved in cellulose biosynthesis
MNEPMLSPAWLLSWWRVYGSERRLRVGLFHEGNRLIGLAPLHSRRFAYRPGIPFRRLEFVGSDVDEQDGVCSDYLNIVAEAGKEERVVAAFAQALIEGAFGPWDELVLPAMDGEGAMPALLVHALQRVGVAASRLMVDQAPYVELPATWEAYLERLPKKKRYGIVRALRDMQAWAAGSLQLHVVTSLDDLERGKRILIDLHNERWSADGERGAFRGRRFAAFHDALMPQFLQRGELELMWLSGHGEPVAAHYNIVAAGKVYHYQCGRRMDLPKGLRPGIVLLAEAIQRAIRAGRREFDLLAGVSQYKMDLTHTTRPLVQVRAVRSCLVEKLRTWAERGIGWARHWSFR